MRSFPVCLAPGNSLVMPQALCSFWQFEDVQQSYMTSTASLEVQCFVFFQFFCHAVRDENSRVL